MPLSQFLIKEIIGEHDCARPKAAPMRSSTPSRCCRRCRLRLRLQIVRSVAQVTQTTPAELEVLFELESRWRARSAPRAPSAPPRSGWSADHAAAGGASATGADLDAAALEAIARIAGPGRDARTWSVWPRAWANRPISPRWSSICARAGRV
jgi:DNA primase